MQLTPHRIQPEFVESVWHLTSSIFTRIKELEYLERHLIGLAFYIHSARSTATLKEHNQGVGLQLKVYTPHPLPLDASLLAVSMILMHQPDAEIFSPPSKASQVLANSEGKNSQINGHQESPLTPTSRSLKGTNLEASETASHDTIPSSIVDDHAAHGSTHTLTHPKLLKDTDLDYATVVESGNKINEQESIRIPQVKEETDMTHLFVPESPKSRLGDLAQLSRPYTEKATSPILDQTHARPFHLLKDARRHTSPVPVPLARRSIDVVRTKRSLDQGYRLNHSHYQPPIASKHLVSRSTFPNNDRATSSIDLHHLRKLSGQDLASSEISRMRNSIIVKRNIQRRKKEFLEDDTVYVGNKITEGHQNFVMAYNMLTGIRVAVSRCSGVMKKLNDADFKATKKLTFNMDGSELTPSSKYDFKFKDYCPEVFRELRSLFGIDPADYLISITGKYILSELGSPGKSGSFFYYSRDFRFIIKTIHHSEHKQLRRILKDYHHHVKANPNTLISQFYGLHRLKVQGGIAKIHFIVMNNLFPPHRDIHIKYDLKGSTWGRYTNMKDQLLDLSQVTLKDVNFLERNDKIHFGPDKRKMFLEQLEADVRLLKKINVMDYSLLLGVHDVKKGNSKNPTKLSIFDPKSNVKSDVFKTNPRDIDRGIDLPKDVFPGRSKYIFYGHDGGIRATNENNDPVSEIYYLGIIDCLTNYSLKKQLETFWRSLSHTRNTISAIPAAEYGDRFLKFIKNGISSEKLKKT